MAALGTLFRVIDRPGQAMEEVADRSRWWLIAAALLVISMLALLYVSAPYQVEVANERSAQMIERITASLTPEQAEAARSRAQDTTVQRLMLMGGGVALIMMALGWVLRGTIVHFTSMALGGRSAWAATYAVGVWSMLPYFVRDVVQIIYVLVQKQVPQHAGLSFLVASGDWLKDSQSVTYSLLSNADPFALWHLLVFAVAISVATKVGQAKGAILAIIIFALFLGLKLVPVLLSSAVTGQFMG